MTSPQLRGRGIGCWFCQRHNNQISGAIEPTAFLVHAKMCAALANRDEGMFTEAHELNRKWRVPKEMIGRRLSCLKRKRRGCWASSVARASGHEAMMLALRSS